MGQGKYDRRRIEEIINSILCSLFFLLHSTLLTLCGSLTPDPITISCRMLEKTNRSLDETAVFFFITAKLPYNSCLIPDRPSAITLQVKLWGKAAKVLSAVLSQCLPF